MADKYIRSEDAKDALQEKAELEAEKRTIKKFLECDMITDQKLYAIGTLLEEET